MIEPHSHAPPPQPQTRGRGCGWAWSGGPGWGCHFPFCRIQSRDFHCSFSLFFAAAAAAAQNITVEEGGLQNFLSPSSLYGSQSFRLVKGRSTHKSIISKL